MVEWNESVSPNTGDDFTNPPIVGLVAMVLEGLLMVLILAGNGLVMAVYLRSPSLHTVSNFYIVQLAVADICVGALMPVHIAMYLHPRWMTKYLHLCLFRYTSMLLFQSASIASLVALTCDRFNAVVRPLHYHENVTRRGYVRGILAVWLFPLALGFLLPMFWHNDWESVPARECDFMFVLRREFIGYMMVPAFVICTVLLVTLYVKIFRVAAYHSANIARMEASVASGGGVSGDSAASKDKDSRRLQRDMKMVKTGMIVLGGFYLCWLPFIITSAIQAYSGLLTHPQLKYARTMALFPAIFNSALNPIIYSFRLSAFKVEFRKILRLNVITIESNGTSADSGSSKGTGRGKRTSSTTKDTELDA